MDDGQTIQPCCMFCQVNGRCAEDAERLAKELAEGLGHQAHALPGPHMVEGRWAVAVAKLCCFGHDITFTHDATHIIKLHRLLFFGGN